VADNLIIVGDAARQVDPLTGDGILNAMTSGCLAAQVANEALQAGDVSTGRLVAYQEEAERVPSRRLLRSYRLRERFPPGKRANRSFVRLFAVVADGK
jgi:digeranylgeranylglycerophospholipid reductase